MDRIPVNFVKTFVILIILTSFSLLISGSEKFPERYSTYNEIQDMLVSLQDSFPGILHLDTLGYSTSDSIPILLLKISDNPSVDEDEPAVFFCGGVHADEVLGVEVVINFVRDIINKYSHNDASIKTYINKLEIFVVPVVNPEGHIMVELGDIDWRKNKSDNDSNNVFDYHDGVDNNRNYDFGWYIDNSVSATTPESIMFKGYYPFSESENRAIHNFAWKYRPVIALDYHSPVYSLPETVYYPWLWSERNGGNGPAPDIHTIRTICEEFCSTIINDAGNSHYKARCGLVDKGDLKTYLYGNFGTVAFTIEVSDTTIQNPLLVDNIAARHLPGQYYMLGRALGAGITGIIKDSITLEPLEVEIRVMEHQSDDINPRLSRPDFGSYHRLLNPGKYNLKFIKDGYKSKTVRNVKVESDRLTEINVFLIPQNK